MCRCSCSPIFIKDCWRSISNVRLSAKCWSIIRKQYWPVEVRAGCRGGPGSPTVIKILFFSSFFFLSSPSPPRTPCESARRELLGVTTAATRGYSSSPRCTLCLLCWRRSSSWSTWWWQCSWSTWTTPTRRHRRMPRWMPRSRWSWHRGASVAWWGASLPSQGPQAVLWVGPALVQLGQSEVQARLQMKLEAVELMRDSHSVDVDCFLQLW